MRPSALARPFALLVLSAAAACGSSGGSPCDPIAQAGCDATQVCAPVSGGSPACFDPVYVSGRVYDLATGAGLGGARVVALDVDGAPASRIGTSAPATDPVPGAYALPVPMTRNGDGSPVAASFTLRADRAGYETFPSGLRVALPVSTAGAVHAGGRWTISTGQTNLGLAALAAAPAGRIDGTVALPASGAGVLLVAEETTTHAGLTAVPGSDGAFSIFNVPDGTYEVRAFAQGVNFAPVTVTVTGGAAAPASAALAATAGATATVSGSVAFVSATSWPTTSVLLVVASTFDEARARGVAPPGLKAAGVANAADWSIAGVPDGHYRVLAGFETDYLVRDPSDTGGTAVLDFSVEGGLVKVGGATVTTLEGFKITGAIRLTAPLKAADGTCTSIAAAALPADPAGLFPGACTLASATPVLSWQRYPGTDHYLVTVIDEEGTVAWRASVDKAATDDETSTTYGAGVGTAGVVSVDVAPQALVDGRTYQVKVTSVPVGGVPLSYSEDLLGVFTYVAPPPP